MSDLRLGYRESPFERDSLRVRRLDNPDQHPTAPVVELNASDVEDPIRLTRADVRRLFDYLAEPQSGRSDD